MEIINANSRNMNMLNKLLSERKAVIFFVAPWCGHCKQLEPTIDSLMGRFKNYKNPGVIARVEESEIPNFNYDNEIQGYPTIRIMSNGKKIKDYEGPRDENSLSEMFVRYFNKRGDVVTNEKDTKKIVKKRKKKRKKKRLEILRKKKRRRKTKSKGKKQTGKKQTGKKQTKKKNKPVKTNQKKKQTGKKQTKKKRKN
jgi:thioredoxin-like negative regulator of GroEL